MTTALPQHMQALEQANEVRRGVRAFGREVRALPPREAARVVADVFELDHEDRILGAARVRFLLDAVPYMHPKTLEKLLVLASCSKNADVRVRDLTPRQRTVISSSLRLWDGRGIGYRS